MTLDAKLLSQAFVQPSSLSSSNAASSQDLSKIVAAMKESICESKRRPAEQRVLDSAADLLNCETCIFYMYDSEMQTLQTADKEDSFPSTEGILGRCVASGAHQIVASINLDADYSNSARHEALDIEAKSLLCYPIKDCETGEIFGVLEAINKSDDSGFSSRDVELIAVIGTLREMLMRNGIVYEMAKGEQQRNQSMLALWAHLNDESQVFNMNSLLFTITRRCLEIVQAEKCSFYFIDQGNQELWSMQGDEHIRLPLSKGLVGWCATTGNIVNEDDAMNHAKFDPSQYRKSGVATKSVLCAPMKGRDDKVIGVIQLINKKGVIESFDQNDEWLLAIILAATSLVVEKNYSSFPRPDAIGAHKQSPKKDDKFVGDLCESEARISHTSKPEFDALLEEDDSEEPQSPVSEE